MLESELATAIGIPRTQLREYRKKHPEKAYKKGREVHWTDDGVEWVKETLELSKDEPLKPSTYSAHVIRADFPNQKLVQVVADVRGMRELLLVRVRNSGLFSKHMKVEIRPDGNGWSLARQPRQRGRF